MKLHQRMRRERGEHTDDWLVTYADTITLLLCLFVLILSIKTAGQSLAPGQTAPAGQTRDARQIVAKNAIFEIPSCFADTKDGAVAVTPLDGIVGAAMNAETETTASPVRADDLGTPAAEIIPASLPAIVDRLNAQGIAAIAQQGDRITTMRVGSAALFGSGDATISNAGQFILRDMAVRLNAGEFAAYHITIEGHTDDTPIRTIRFQSNWELSTARAASVVRFLLEQGVAAERLTAAGYADTFPVAPNRDADGRVNPENQARNRRVLIKLEKIDATPG